MLRILCVSPYFVPRADSEAFCGGKFILELLKRGIDVTVLSRDPLYPHAKVCDSSKLWEPLKEITVNIKTPAYKERLHSLGIGLRYGVVEYGRWVKATIDSAIALYREKPFDVLYSRALPMESHVAAYWIAQRLNIPWIANINDPWDWHLFPEEMRLEYPLHQRMMSTFWMKKTLQAAALITYPSARLREYHVRLSGISHRSEILPHIGYSAAGQHGEPGFRLVHTGKLGGLEKRSSDGLLMGLNLFIQKHPEAKREFRLILVGPSDKKTDRLIEQWGLRSLVVMTGRVSYEQSLEYISSASVCVLVEAGLSEGIFLPSKLADYLAAGKPVLAISPRVGVLSDMAAGDGVSRVDGDDPRAVEAAISRYYRAFQQGSLESCRPSHALASQFQPDRIMNLFLHLVRNVRDSNVSRPQSCSQALENGRRAERC